MFNSSKAWSLMSRDYLKSPEATRQLVNRLCAWVTALRYQTSCRYCGPRTTSSFRLPRIKKCELSALQRKPSFCRVETSDCKPLFVYRQGILLGCSHSIREAAP